MTSSHGRAYGSSRPAKIALGLAGWLLAGQLSASTSASPITSALSSVNPLPNLVKSTQNSFANQISELESMFGGGPTHRATSRLQKAPQGVSATGTEGTPKDNKAIDYLMWVRDQHPDTFDRRHPNLGPKLALAQAQRLAGTQYVAYLPSSSPSTPAGSTQTLSLTQAQTQPPPQAQTQAQTQTPTQSSVAAQSAQTPQAQVLQPPALAQTPPSSQGQLLPFPMTALALLSSPSTPAVRNLPTPGSSSASTASASPAALTSSVGATNLQATGQGPLTAGQGPLAVSPTTLASAAAPATAPVTATDTATTLIPAPAPSAESSLTPATESAPAEVVPEPSSVALTLLLFGSAACWSRWRTRG